MPDNETPPPACPPQHAVILERAGLLLLRVGLADTCLLACCLVLGLRYPSPLSLFAVLGGFHVRRGGLKVSFVAAWLAAFVAGGLGSGIALVWLWMPLGLIRAMLKLDLERTFFQYLLPFCDTAFLVWVFSRLRGRPVRDAVSAEGAAPSGWRGRPALGFVFGAVLMSALVGVQIWGPFSGREVAVAQARKALPGDYSYFAVQFSGGPERFNALVVAYNDHELHWIPIRKKS
jgi:hypothetical protein